MGRGLNLNLKLAMAAKSIKPVSINEAVLNDLASRFLLNIPREDQDDPMKLCTHIELAYWFYLDLVRPEDSTLPGCSMKEFMAATSSSPHPSPSMATYLTVFKHCPFLVKDSVMVDLDNYVAQWKAHKYKKPVRGGIILNHDWTKCLLVQGYPASTTWGFPKGKLEEGENDIDAAVRELYEETGFDSRGIIKEKWHLVAQVNGSEAKMYIIPGVPDNTHFEPKTRKEIRSIQWFRIDGLPRHRKDLTSKQALGKSANSFFMIIPFISQLKKWIASNSKGSARASKGKTISAHFQNPVQQQSHSKSSVPQTDSKPASPSAPPLDVISHRYGMGYGNETGEYRTGYGGMGMYNAPYSGTEIHNYQSTNHPSLHHHAPPPPQSPMTTNTSRDDTAPIPYPPQHPHTLHPNHTLPAPLHHTTTTGYHSHNAVYPSHLTYTNNSSHHPHHHHQQVHYHQLHHQQDHPSPHVPSNHHHHYPYYVQPVTMYPSGGSVNPTQQYGTGSMQQPQKSDSSPAHAAHGAAAVHVGPYHVQRNATPHPVVAKPPPTTGHVSTRPPPPPPSVFPIATPGPGPGHAQQRSPHRMPAAATTSTNQHPHLYYQTYHTVAATPSSVPAHAAAARQLFPPSTTTQSSAAVHYPPAAAGWQIHSSAHPQTQGQLYGRVGHQQVSPQTRTQDRAAGQYDNMQYQQVSRSRDGEEVASADLARLRLEQGGGMAHYLSSPRTGDAGQDGYYSYSVVLKPAASMVGFKFNTEAILKASNQH